MTDYRRLRVALLGAGAVGSQVAQSEDALAMQEFYRSLWK